ncbi:CHAD domain-containing protein [Rhodococcus maanshanensis]|uniref:CHAD domain-containing protein n=1 Tax=Rhodococcus maanshanensis TaxID=183556 RepID=A0A1H7VVI6_9NOCA|nr:CHAD domain-containing protein [Rhodococcus maanshanensis]SEM12768.1 CHAD domain-containing protein [Rhodococcus maanshanensis]
MGKGRTSDGTTVVLAALREHADELDAHADGVRRDEFDSVHQMRVSARRLRSALGSYRSLFPDGDTDGVRAELRWLGTVLGNARDAEVMAERFRELLDAQPPELIRGPVRHRLIETNELAYRDAHTEAVATLDGPRYEALLAALDALLAAAPQRHDAVRSGLHHARRRVRKAARKAGLTAGGTGEPTPERLHTVRKRAKALRYAAEAAASTRPSPVRAGKAAKKLQTVLGDHHDSVVARSRLLAAADLARGAGEDTFTYGVLTAVEADRVRVAVPRSRKLVRKIRSASRKL